MKSLIIMVLIFLTLSVGTKAQENQKVFTAEEQSIYPTISGIGWQRRM